MKIDKTHYQIAWEKYLKSTDYERAEKALSEKGIVQPYLNNILQLPFNYGYNQRWHDKGEHNIITED